MKNLTRILMILAIVLLYSCEEKPVPPTVTTTTVSEISYTTATSGGNITDEGGASIITRGICWSTATSPTIDDDKTIGGTGVGIFTSEMTDLTPNMTYYIRAYAMNSAGTGYGNQVSFTTLQTGVPELTTTEVTSITHTSAVSGGNITDDNGSSITARGLCWDTSSNPTTGDNKTSDGSGTGTFTSTITDLQPGTEYYVRAYATNSIGTSYGNEQSFVTLTILPTITTNSITEISGTSAQSGGNITSDGGSDITEKGICWSKIPNPTTDDFKTNEGPSTEEYTSNLNGLEPETNYYVRAYATNSEGTAYGNELSFTTTALTIGDYYQGGKVAYILQVGDPGYVPEEIRGIIVASTDQHTDMRWYNGVFFSVGATGTAIYTGKSNTNNIVTAQGDGDYAAKLCYDLVLNGYDDWYLPSRDELVILYQNREIIGGFPGFSFYWSSTEYNDQTAIYHSFFNDGETPGPWFKTGTHHVRAIRYFPSFPVTIPILTTTSASSITSSSAIVGGEITADGGDSVIDRGIFWSESTNPTVSDNVISEGSGIGTFTCSITELESSTTYYCRAYATNSAGTAYGNEISFTTIIVPVTGVSLDITSAEIKVGSIKQLTATLEPANATNQNISWSSSNTSIATVSSSGLVTAIEEGDAIITVTTEDGSFEATCDVEVLPYYCEIGEVYTAVDGLTVTLNSFTITETTGSYKYSINYTLVNNTTDQAIDEGTFKMYYANKTGGLPQYGSFGTLYPEGSVTRSYTFEELKSDPFGVLEYHHDNFFSNTPIEESLKWEVIIP